MPTFNITSPDGRQFKITGDRAPTEQELNQLVSSAPVVETPSVQLDEQKSSVLSQAGLNPEAIAKSFGRDLTDEEVQTLVQQKQAGEQREERAEDVEKTRGRLRALGQGVTFGLGEEAESLITGQPVGRIREEQAEFAKDRPLEALGLDIAGGIASGGTALKALKAIPAVARLGQAASLGTKIARGAGVGVGAGALQGATRAKGGERLKGARIGAVIGGVIGGAIPAVGAGLKQVKKATPFGAKKLARSKVKDVIEEAGDLDFKNVVRSDKGTAALREAVRVDDDLARQIRSRADDELINTQVKTTNIVKKNLDTDSLDKLSDKAYEGYNKFLAKTGNKQVPMNKIKNLQGIKLYKELEKEARQLNPLLKGKPSNSVVVIQETKRRLGAVGAGGSKESSLARELNRKVKDVVDTNFPGFKQLNKEFADAKQTEKVLDTLLSPKGGETSNISRSLLSNKNKELVANRFGKEKSTKLFDALRKQGRENERLTTLFKEADRKLIKPSTELGEDVARKIGGAKELLRTTVEAGTLGKGRRTGTELGNILLQNKAFTPTQQNALIKAIRQGAPVGTIGALQGE